LIYPADIIAPMSDAADPALLGSELRLALGQLVRRLRVEHRLSLSQGAVLARLDRDAQHSISTLAAAERIRPQSMAQTIRDLEADGLIERRADPSDGRRTLVDMTAQGRRMLEEDRRRREGWLTEAITHTLTPEEREDLVRAVALLRRLGELDTPTG
jgi:DNA-binding MarR family transcriptional regulator